MTGDIGRPPGSKKPGRYRSPAVTSAIELLSHRPPDELAVARHAFTRAAVLNSGIDGLLTDIATVASHVRRTHVREESMVIRNACAHWLAGQNGYVDDQRRSVTSPHNLWVLGFDTADLRCRAETDHGLRSGVDYGSYRPKWAPHPAGIRPAFAGVDQALRRLGLLYVAQPEAHLIRADGSFARRSDATLDDLPPLMAAALQRNVGRRMSPDSWNDIAETEGGNWPTYRQVLRIIRGHYHWFELQDAGYAYARAHPSDFPEPAAYTVAARALRSGNSS